MDAHGDEVPLKVGEEYVDVHGNEVMQEAIWSKMLFSVNSEEGLLLSTAFMKLLIKDMIYHFTRSN